jgi:patatin-related protein
MTTTSVKAPLVGKLSNGVPAYEAMQEIRFAVVIYGGVSLCIYINGIVQEMLRLVRATAPSDANQDGPLLSDVTGSEAVYRKLGQLVGDPDRAPTELSDRMKLGEVPPIRTRFVIDVLSGASAGGINAVFLAKALVNGVSLKALERVWITEGDIEKLINDSDSLKDADERLAQQSPPPALLNGQRMYLKLLDALDTMDDEREASAPVADGALVDRLDLFCTATDLAGLRKALPLADGGKVDERRHRAVFHFAACSRPSASRLRSDFVADDNPFLAFAARCTSAFPFAFEPMTLGDIFPILRTSRRHRDRDYCYPAAQHWQRLYPDYRKDPDRVPFEQRAFGDGGYLDNKPFSYAIETTISRYSDLPVRRKLVYVEPKPSVFTLGGNERPNALQNSVAALTTLPRDETIREDLEVVIRRNAEIERLGRVIADIRGQLGEAVSGLDPTKWLRQSRQDVVRSYGLGYIAYERLKLSEVTDQLSQILARCYGFERIGIRWAAIRVLIGVWRENEYHGDQAQRQFLLDFDIGYRVRRLRHISLYLTELDESAGKSSQMEELPAYRAELRAIKRKLRVPHETFQELLEKAWDVTEVGIALDELDVIMAPERCKPGVSKALGLDDGDVQATPEGERRRGQLVMARHRAALDRLGKQVAAAVKQACDESRKACLNAFGVDPSAYDHDMAMKALHSSNGVTEGARAARQAVASRYFEFERYDAVLFPISFGTEIGEGQVIDIHRISPDDARARIADVALRGSKLKGHALGSFGAFLDDTWRKNDILWGRLDGAERLIHIALPGNDHATAGLRSNLVNEAHIAIIDEFFSEHAPEWLGRQPESVRKSQFKTFSEYIAQVVRPEPKPPLVARAAARSLRVTGDLLGAIYGKRQWASKPLAWFAFIGRLSVGLIEVAIPRSLGELFFEHGLKLLVVFSLFLGVLGAIISDTALLKLAGAMFVVCAALYVLVSWLRRFMTGQPGIPGGLRLAGGVLLSGLLAAATFSASSYVPRALVAWNEVADGRLPVMPVASMLWQVVGALGVGAMLGCLLTLVNEIRISARVEAVRGSRHPVVKLRFAGTWGAVKASISHADHRVRNRMRDLVNADFWLIGSYAPLFVVFAIVLVVRGLPWGALVGLLGIAAAAAHFTENVRVLRLLDAVLPADEKAPADATLAPVATALPALHAPRGPAIVKLFALSGAILCAAVVGR